MNFRPLVALLWFGTAGAGLAADQMPHYKPGLWEITLAMMSKPAKESVCLDDATQKLMLQVGLNATKELCSKREVHSSGSQVTVDTECKIGEATRSSHTVMTFTGDTSYHTVVTSHREPPTANRADTTSTMDGKWVGACPADMKPGDAIVSVDGMSQPMRMNLNDMFNK